jgi:hypothetical protein
VISTLRASNDSIDEAAEYFSLSPHMIRAARDYYADFRDEVDADEADAHRIAERERERWERQQRPLS